jgi:acetyl esterase/lipase
MRKVLFATVACFTLVSGGSIRAQAQPRVTRTEDVVYGRKFGTALTLDVFEPENKNGAAIFFVVSGGWISDHQNIKPQRYQPLLDHGYTVFAVVHGSQPRFLVPETEEDIHRAVRFVRHNAARWNSDPDRFGISGGSAGGQLSLMIGAQGGPGKPDSKDPVDRESSAVQAVACFYPPTDFLNFGGPGELCWLLRDSRTNIGMLGPRAATREGQREVGKEISPISFVTAQMPPTLIYQGDSDKKVPLYQAQTFEQRCKEVGALCKLVIKPGAGHAAEFGDHVQETEGCADWFDAHLIRTKAKR